MGVAICCMENQKYAYGLVELDRIWNLVIDGWMCEICIHQVPFFPELFIHRNSSSIIHIALGNVFMKSKSMDLEKLSIIFYTSYK